jgi:hypothetical protein
VVTPGEHVRETRNQQPDTVPVVKLRRIHVKPRPGVASSIAPSGQIDRKPHSGPRNQQRSGQVLMAT